MTNDTNEKASPDMPQAASETPFPSVLRAFRAEYHLTQADLAQALEISVNTVKAWERGDPKRKPHILTREGILARLLVIKQRFPVDAEEQKVTA